MEPTHEVFSVELLLFTEEELLDLSVGIVYEEIERSQVAYNFCFFLSNDWNGGVWIYFCVGRVEILFVECVYEPEVVVGLGHVAYDEQGPGVLIEVVPPDVDFALVSHGWITTGRAAALLLTH